MPHIDGEEYLSGNGIDRIVLEFDGSHGNQGIFLLKHSFTESGNDPRSPLKGIPPIRYGGGPRMGIHAVETHVIPVASLPSTDEANGFSLGLQHRPLFNVKFVIGFYRR